MYDKVASIIRTKRIGLDGVTITPIDKHGMCYVYLIVVTATKLVAEYPVDEHFALSVARSLYSFRVTYVHYDELTTDPDSDIMDRNSPSSPPVDVNTSNGVEPYCKQDEPSSKMSGLKIAGPSLRTLALSYSSSTATLTLRPLIVLIYMNLPETTDKFTYQDEYVTLLNDILQSLRSTAKQCRDSNEFKRVSSTDSLT